MLRKPNEDDMLDEMDGYDSMIENGTSDDDSDDDGGDSEDLSQSKTKESVENVQASNATLKRKADTKVAPENKEKTTTNVKKSKLEKVKPPTLEEINELKETRNLFHSNLFRLQVKEMLTELKVKEKYTSYLNSWLEQFKIFINKLPAETSKEDCNELQWLENSTIKMPLITEHLRGEKRSFQFQFIKPNCEPFFIGAAATESLFGAKLYADVCITMPAACFQKENYLDLVYEQKRALYLVFITNELLKNGFDNIKAEQVQFNYYKNNPLKPVLEITPSGKVNSKQKLCIRLFIAAEEASFKLSRFVPWNNNIRSKIFSIEEDTTETTAPPTPSYNSIVLFDLTMKRNHEVLLETFQQNKNFKEGLVLLKVWLQQRQLELGFVGFSTHILAMYICYLQQQRKLHKNMSSYQVARTVWNQLGHSTWDEADKGITLCPNSVVASNRPTLSQFHEHFKVVFVDSTGFYNICANVSLEMYRRVRFEAKLAVDMLNDMKLNSFQALFMTKYPIYAQIDHLLKISKPDAVEQILEMHVPLAAKQNYAGAAFPQLLEVVGSLLRKGLDKRIQTMLTIEAPMPSWPCNESPDVNVGRQLQLGLILDPNHAYEVLDKGPESIDSKAEEFRRFWGDKAKLRRFQDGSITESVVWASVEDTLAQKRLVSREIVLHLLQHHFQLEASDLFYIGGELDVVYKLTPAYKTERMHAKFQVSQNTDAEALCLRVIQNFDDLARKLHALKELPLEIVTIIGTSAVFRYCEPTPLLPTARMINEDMYASEVQCGIIQLAMSGKWPSELKALQAMKTAFYIQIAQLIREKYKLSVKVTHSGMLVIKQGYCFKIELAHPKELALLKQTKTERGITSYVDSIASIELEKRHYVLPKVTGALHALHHQYPSFGGTVMIAKRWLYAQLIDNGLWPDECTELLVAILFVRATNEQQITCSPQTGFIRFLQLIAYADWKAELFLLNFNNSLDETQISDLEQRFSAERTQFPQLCIATAYDRGHYGKLWTNDQRPSVNVLARVTLLARQALELIETSFLNPHEMLIKPSKLFMPSTEGYDLVIQLRADEVPNTTAFDFGASFTAFTKPNWRLPLAGANFLVDAVSKLREAYSEFAAFFYNPCGGSKIIGVVWKPSAFIEKEFKVNDVNGCQLTGTQKLQCQRGTFIEDFKFILKDFCIRIDTVENILEASKTASLNNPPTSAMKQRYFSDVKTTKSTTKDNKISTKIAEQKKSKDDKKKKTAKNIKQVKKQKYKKNANKKKFGKTKKMKTK